jgi:hypothetical protein
MVPVEHSGSAAWMQAMLNGQFEQAWQISDAVIQERSGRSCTDQPHHLRWVWDGTPLVGRRVLVRCYHGLGDTLQFVRFLPLIAATAKEVALEAQTSLLPLLRSVGGIAALYPLDEAPPRWDVAIESMELPHALRTTLDTLPARVPYLELPPRGDGGATAPPLDGGRMRVGLVWAAGDWRRERSVPPSALLPLTRLPLELVGLQFGPGGRDRAAAALSRAFSFAIADDTTVGDTARLMHDLDLVITVDTMAAHLAGAFGRPVWVLLDADSDWRWMRHRSDSPWYPTMRLFRQPRQGDWTPVIESVTARLSAISAMEGIMAAARRERAPDGVVRRRSGDVVPFL